MNQVKDRFVDYKLALDSLWVNNRNGVLLSTAFDLGTGAPATAGTVFALPILTPAGSGGTVSVNEGGAELTIEAGDEKPVPIPLGSLSYRSSNNYWVDQTWTYQMGAVFLSQEGGTTVRVGPSIAAYNTSTGNTTLTLAPISLDGSAMIAGSGPVRVETRMRWGNQSTLDGVYENVTLTIEADDPVTAGAWQRAFSEVGQRARDEDVNISEWKIGRYENTSWLYVKPQGSKYVILSMYPANYTVTIHNAASLAE